MLQRKQSTREKKAQGIQREPREVDILRFGDLVAREEEKISGCQVVFEFFLVFFNSDIEALEQKCN